MSNQSHCPITLPTDSEQLLAIGSPSSSALPPGDPSVDSILHASEISHKNVGTQDESNVAISMLPDDILLEIFDMCRKNHYNHPHPRPVWKWHPLVQVCQKWRQIIFSSPLRLNLQILCTYGTPVSKDLDIAVTVLEHSDRVSFIGLHITGLQLEKIVMGILEPFPLLTRLHIHLTDESEPVVPDEFLGGFAPRLQEVYLHGIPFPALPTLLLSTSHLAILTLSMIPYNGYISPEAMVACLAMLPKLERLTIEFETDYPSPDGIRPPPAARSILPALTDFNFQGTYEYLEDIVAHIDGPQLNWIWIAYLNQPLDFQVTQLSEFIDNSVGSESTPSRRAHVTFHVERVAFTLYRQANGPGWDGRRVETAIYPDALNWKIPEMAWVLSQLSSTFYPVVHLEIVDALYEDGNLIERAYYADWLDLFCQFPAMQILHVSGYLSQFVGTALKEIATEAVAEVFPSLRLICLEYEPESSVETIVAARRHSDCPVTFVQKKAEFEKILQSYTIVSK